MSSYGTIYLEKLNKKEKKWEHYCLYDKDQDGNFKALPLWEGQGYLRDIIANEDLSDYSSPFVVDSSKLDNVSEYVSEKYHKYDGENLINKDEIFNYTYHQCTMTYAQILIYLKNNPTIYSYEEYYNEETDKYDCDKIENPMKNILEKIDMIRDMKDDWDFNNSKINDFRIVCWTS